MPSYQARAYLNALQQVAVLALHAPGRHVRRQQLVVPVHPRAVASVVAAFGRHDASAFLARGKCRNDREATAVVVLVVVL